MKIKTLVSFLIRYYGREEDGDLNVRRGEIRTGAGGFPTGTTMYCGLEEDGDLNIRWKEIGIGSGGFRTGACSWLSVHFQQVDAFFCFYSLGGLR
jgi:hypothetical protein